MSGAEDANRIQARPIVARVRGFCNIRPEVADSILRRVLDAGIRASSSGDSYQVAIVSACDQEDELVALVDFHDGLPDFLSELKQNPQGSCPVFVDELDDDLSFDIHFFGFTQLYNTDSSQAIVADIVAITGLDGHAYGSWQARTGTRRMWLRHFLRKDLPNCRTMIYGYDSKLKKPGFSSIEDYSRGFLEDLRTIRDKEARKRPLIFIAHSFGGILLARSLIKVARMNDSDQSTLASLHRATSGICFFAVPHRGLDIEDMKRIMGTEQHPRTGLVHQINIDSETLKGQLLDFKDILDDTKVVTFYETEQSRRLQRHESGEWKRTGEYFTSLESESALLQLPKSIETPIPLHSDHSNIVKFGNNHSIGYKRLLPHLKDFLEKGSESIPAPCKPELRPTLRSCWTVPFDKHQHFVGRSEQLEQLEKVVFSANQYSRFAVYGLGGVGKTQLLVELAYKIKSKLPECSIIWIPATDDETMHNAYLDAARRLGIPGVEHDKANVKRLLQRYLSDDSVGRWVVIYDNADNLDMWFDKDKGELTETDLMKSVPRSSAGHVLFTTRDRKVAMKLACQNILKVPDEDTDLARQIACDSIGDSDPNDPTVEALITQLAFLPLAITQAAAYIKENGIGISTYLAIFQEHEQSALELLSEDFQDYGRYVNTRNPVATTWLVSFDQIRTRRPLAINYLAFMACVSPRDVPQSLLPPGESTKEEVDAIGTLDAYSFISRRMGDSEGFLSVHRLVHLAMRKWLSNEGLLHYWVDNVLLRLEEMLPTPPYHDEIAVCRKFLPHAHEGLKLNDGRDTAEQYSSFTFKYGCCQELEGKFKEAEELYRISVELDSSRLGPKHVCTLKKTLHLSRSISDQARWDESSRLTSALIETSSEVLGTQHNLTMEAMSLLGHSLKQTGHLEEAEKLQEQVIRFLREQYGDEDRETLYRMNQLAQTFKAQCRLKEAEVLQEYVVETSKRILAPDDQYWIEILEALAEIYFDQGRYREMEALQTQVLHSVERAFPCEHRKRLHSMNNLALAYKSCSRFQEAEQLWLQAIGIAKRVLGDQDHLRLVIMGNLALVFQIQGRYNEAEKLLKQVVDATKDILGNPHRYTLYYMSELAMIWDRLGRLGEAEQLLEKVLGTQKVKLGPEHPNSLRSMSCLASVLRKLGRMEQAWQLEAQVLESNNKVLGPEHPHTLTSLYNSALDLWDQGRQGEATRLMRSARESHVKILGEDHPYTVACKECVIYWERTCKQDASSSESDSELADGMQGVKIEQIEEDSESEE